MDDKEDLGVRWNPSESDRRLAALSWLALDLVWPLLAIGALFSGPARARPYVRYHVLKTILAGILFGPVLLLLPLYYAYLAYKGEAFFIPVVSPVLGWIFPEGDRA